MNTTNDNKVMACVDHSPYAHVVADYAAWAAVRIQAPIELLHVIDKHEQPSRVKDHSGTIGLDAHEALLKQLSDEDRSKAQQAKEQGRVFLAALRERAVAHGAHEVDMRQRYGQLQDTLAERAHGVRLVVLGRKGVSASEHNHVLGRHVEQMVRAVQKPILAVTNAFVEPQRVMLAFDGGAATRRGVDTLARSPLLKGLPIRIQMSGAKNHENVVQLQWAQSQLRQAGFEVTGDIHEGEPAAVIAQAIKDHDIDLLVMGAYSHAPWRKWLFGSHTNELLRAVEVPTLLLR
jgi:nucleotide-binding universal stress UspA family protein